MGVSTDYINTGGGKLYIELFVAGVLSGKMEYFGITENVNLATEVEYLEHKNTETKYTKTDKKVQKSVGATITFGTAEISTEMLARAYGGKVTEEIQATQTAQPVTITGALLGGTYPIGFFAVTTIVVKDSGDTITYTEGTDYTIDRGAGLITFLETGTCVDSADQLLTVTADAYTSNIVAGLVEAQIEAKLTFISEPLAGSRFKYEFKKVAISASGDLSLKGEEFMVLNFEGSALSDETVTDPILSDYFDMKEIPA